MEAGSPPGWLALEAGVVPRDGRQFWPQQQGEQGPRLTEVASSEGWRRPINPGEAPSLTGMSPCPASPQQCPAAQSLSWPSYFKRAREECVCVGGEIAYCFTQLLTLLHNPTPLCLRLWVGGGKGHSRI